jgi:RHS repeat-associated protein
VSESTLVLFSNSSTGPRDFYLDNLVITDLSVAPVLQLAADVISNNDYYPFGLAMEGRSYSDSTYRYGFNGKEKDDEGELGGDTNYDYGFRIYNPRMGRFLSVDPLTSSYPNWSPYPFAMNRPIDGIDLDGLEWATVKDDGGNAVDFKWDPENARDKEGNLKSGYYESAVLFSEKTKEPESGDAKTFHAVARVYKTDGTTEDYDGTTLPSDNELFGTVAPGMYYAMKGTHPMSGGYEALNVYTLSGSRDLPALNGENPRDGGSTVSGVNVHKTGKKDYLGTYKKENGHTGGISEGCFNIKRGKDDTNYNDFLANFKSGSRIGIILKRTSHQTIKQGLNIPTGKTYLSRGRERSMFEKIYDYFFYEKYDDSFFDTLDRYENSKKR